MTLLLNEKTIKRKLRKLRNKVTYAEKITTVQHQELLGISPIYVMLISKNRGFWGRAGRQRDAGMPMSLVSQQEGVGLVMRWGLRRGGAKVRFGVGRYRCPSKRHCHVLRTMLYDSAIRNASDLKIIFSSTLTSVL